MLWVVKVSNSKELIVMRTTGLTIRKITLPIFLVSIILGLFFVIVFSPLISATQKKILSIEADVLGKPINSILVTNSGFWVKQGNISGNDMIYAKSLNSKIFNILSKIDQFLFKILDFGILHLYLILVIKIELQW